MRSACRLVAQLRLGDLQIPVAVLRPEEVVDLPTRLAELVVLHQPRDLACEALRPAEDPAVGQRLRLQRLQRGNARRRSPPSGR